MVRFKFSVKQWLKFSAGLFIGLWTGDFIVHVMNVTDPMLGFLVRLGGAGAVAYVIWEKWLRHGA